MGLGFQVVHSETGPWQLEQVCLRGDRLRDRGLNLAGICLKLLSESQYPKP